MCNVIEFLSKCRLAIKLMKLENLLPNVFVLFLYSAIRRIV